MAMEALNVITEDVIVEGTGIIVDIMNAYGVTAAFDAGIIDGDDVDSMKRILDRLEKGRDLTIRLVGSSRPELQEHYSSAVETAASWREKLKGERYHYNTLKIPDDGTVEGRTAAMFEDYQGEPGNSGETVFTEEQMTHMITGAAAIDMDVHVHALGERAIHESLNAIEAAQAAHPESASRYTICHIQVITDQDLDRFAELDVIAQSTPLMLAITGETITERSGVINLSLDGSMMLSAMVGFFVAYESSSLLGVPGDTLPVLLGFAAAAIVGKSDEETKAGLLLAIGVATWYLPTTVYTGGTTADRDRVERIVLQGCRLLRNVVILMIRRQ